MQSPNDIEALHDLALAHLLEGNRDEYRRICTAFLRRFDTAEVVDGLVLRTCVLAPDAVEDFRAVVRLGERAAKTQPTADCFNSLALANLRAGNLDSAEMHAHNSMSLDPGWRATSLNRLVLALAKARRGDLAAARHWLNSVSLRPSAAISDAPRADALGAGSAWSDWAHFDLLRREVENTIFDAVFPADPFPH